MRVNKNRRLALAAASATIFGAVGLASTLALAQAQNPNRELRIGFVSHQHDITDLFGQLEIGFKDKLNAAGVKYKMFQAAPSASNRHDEMLNILENMANLKLDYMVFGPSSLEQNSPGLVRVAAAGTKLLMVDYEPKAGTKFPFDDAVLNWSVYNHGQMGEETGRWIAKHFMGKGNAKPKIIMMWGPVASEISQARGNGVLKAFREAPGFAPEIIYQGYGNFQRDVAYNETEKALIAYPQVQGIIALNSVMALGTMSALEADGKLARVLVTGMGGQPDELEMVARGKIGLAVFRDPRSMGATSADALTKHLRGQAAQIQRVIYTDLRTLDSINSIRQYVPKTMLDIDAKLKR